MILVRKPAVFSVNKINVYIKQPIAAVHMKVMIPGVQFLVTIVDPTIKMDAKITAPVSFMDGMTGNILKTKTHPAKNATSIAKL